MKCFYSVQRIIAILMKVLPNHMKHSGGWIFNACFFRDTILASQCETISEGVSSELFEMQLPSNTERVQV